MHCKFVIRDSLMNGVGDHKYVFYIYIHTVTTYIVIYLHIFELYLHYIHLLSYEL